MLEFMAGFACCGILCLFGSCVIGPSKKKAVRLRDMKFDMTPPLREQLSSSAPDPGPPPAFPHNHIPSTHEKIRGELLKRQAAPGLPFLRVSMKDDPEIVEGSEFEITEKSGLGHLAGNYHVGLVTRKVDLESDEIKATMILDLTRILDLKKAVPQVPPPIPEPKNDLVREGGML